MPLELDVYTQFGAGSAPVTRYCSFDENGLNTAPTHLCLSSCEADFIGKITVCGRCAVASVPGWPAETATLLAESQVSCHPSGLEAHLTLRQSQH